MHATIPDPASNENFCLREYYTVYIMLCLYENISIPFSVWTYETNWKISECHIANVFFNFQELSTIITLQILQAVFFITEAQESEFS